MKAWIQESGCFKPCDAIPLTDRGFRYGMSVFESIMIRNGLPNFLHKHLQRLTVASEKCGFKSELISPDSIQTLLHHSVPDGIARIYVTAGDGAVSAPAVHCRVFVFVEPRIPISQEVYERGYQLAISKEIHHPMFGGLKTGNYWSNLTALNQAFPKNEALLFNAEGELISACMANVFIIQKGVIKTPALSCGARNGVIREQIIQQRQGIECRITRDDLEKADSIFLTSSWLGIMPVTGLEDRLLTADPDLRN